MIIKQNKMSLPILYKIVSTNPNSYALILLKKIKICISLILKWWKSFACRTIPPILIFYYELDFEKQKSFLLIFLNPGNLKAGRQEYEREDGKLSALHHPPDL